MVGIEEMIRQRLIDTDTVKRITPAQLILMVGYPASGKSYYANNLAKDIGGKVVSTDGIRKELWGDESIQGPWEEISKLLHQRISEGLAGGTPMIVDATNLSPRSRSDFTSRYKGYPIEAHVMGTSLDQSILNNDYRVKQGGRGVGRDYYEKLRTNKFNAPPTMDEGFSKIVDVPAYAAPTDEGEEIKRDLTQFGIEIPKPEEKPYEFTDEHVADFKRQLEKLIDENSDKWYIRNLANNKWQEYGYLKNNAERVKFINDFFKEIKDAKKDAYYKVRNRQDRNAAYDLNPNKSHNKPYM